MTPEELAKIVDLLDSMTRDDIEKLVNWLDEEAAEEHVEKPPVS
jgi:ADP-dependent phosphofructokinase/glucokinase